jgi:hypothetical protein
VTEPKKQTVSIFDQPFVPAANSSTEQRSAKAAEYVANQLFNIRKLLEQIADNMKKE